MAALGPKMQKLYPNRAPASGAAKEDVMFEYGSNLGQGDELLASLASPLASAVCSNLPAISTSPSLFGIVDSPVHEARPPSPFKTCPLSPASRVEMGWASQVDWQFSTEKIMERAAMARNLADALRKAAEFASVTPSIRSPIIKTPTSTARKNNRLCHSGESIQKRA